MVQSRPRYSSAASTGTWRLQDQYYKPEEECELQPGIVNFSPAWFQQGHEVSQICRWEHRLIYNQTSDYELEVSALLKARNLHRGGEAWLMAMQEPHLVLGGMLKIMHPDLYKSSLAALLQLQDQEEHATVLAKWGTVFNALSFISNRAAPLHRDSKSRKDWYDLLVSFGTYADATFHLPGLGMQFPYRSGTIVAFSGSLLRHGVSAHEGERACLAYYMRESVHKRLGVPMAGWMTVGRLEGPDSITQSGPAV